MKQKLEETIPSLCGVYRDYFNIGAAVNKYTIESNKHLLEKHFNSLTAENEMKFENLQREEGVFTFEETDRMISFAEANGMKVRGHTLVWHNQTPDWVFAHPDGKLVNRDMLLNRMEAHILAVVGRYKGKIESWDVVNEAISDDATEYLRKSKWLEIVGEDFIAKAFEKAHLVDPDASLFYNDYNESSPEKREKIYRLVKSLKEKDVPIHGIGLQAHWNIAEPKIDDIRAAIERYASLGLQIQVTEMDVSVFEWNDKRKNVTEPTASMLELQEKRYEQFFNLFREYRQVITSVTFWGISDAYTWLNDFPVKGRRNWPFVFDEAGKPKGAYWNITRF
ncbi:endo-1,4-beta-xylanase [Evansella cellulosilytica]|uniref:Beta-xylanase n=1 Tax=Evansella cellulosilytica (strain ATCC 21833 / DSM 2522 / FERM P-1141 / JCM 9156 / N-4) TaxID=649639 RepID=E6TXL5_EVAC2|nr:endo-1,4-beta-xylanase [Evansella cellulosilytica]ADU28829.1 Endo-1,4-beta-xylanase [Evansella cellulosilytica DSM 2522]